MQKNVLTVVAVAGSCAVLYILYRLKLFSKKNCVETEDKAMGKSKPTKLNGTKENIVYASVMFNESSLDMKPEDFLPKPICISPNRSKVPLQAVSGNHKEATAHNNESNLVTPGLCLDNFEIDNSNAEIQGSTNKFSNESIVNNTEHQLEHLNNSLEGENYKDDESFKKKFDHLDVNKNRSMQEYNYYKSNNVNIPNENCMDSSSSSCSNLSTSPEFITNTEDKFQNKSQIEICNATNEKWNSSVHEGSSNECSIKLEHLSLTNLECDDAVPNVDSELINVNETSTCTKAVENLLDVKNGDNSSNLELNGLEKLQNSIVSLYKEGEQTNKLSTPIVNFTSDHKCENSACNCDKNVNLDENIRDSISDVTDNSHLDENTRDSLSDITDTSHLDENTRDSVSDITDNSQMNSLVKPKSKKSRRKKRKSRKQYFENSIADTSSSSQTSNINMEKIGNIRSHSNIHLNIKTKNLEASANVQNASSQALADCSESRMASSIKDSNYVEDSFLYQFEIPQTLVGRLIGKKGSFLNKIKEETNISIVVRSHSDKDLKMCELEGLRSGVFKAVDMIKNYFPVEEFPDFNINMTNADSLIKLEDIIEELFSNPISIPCDFPIEVLASEIVTTGLLWLHQPNHISYPKYKKLVEFLNLFYGDGSTTPSYRLPIERNTVCVCFLPGRGWARCLVINHNDHQAHVRLLDTGEVVFPAVKHLRHYYVSKTTKLPIQAVKVCLYGICPKNGKLYTDVGREFLRKYISNRPLYAYVCGYGPEPEKVPIVKLYLDDENAPVKRRIGNMTKQGVYINEVLVKKGFAKLARGCLLSSR